VGLDRLRRLTGVGGTQAALHLIAFAHLVTQSMASDELFRLYESRSYNLRLSRAVLPRSGSVSMGSQTSERMQSRRRYVTCPMCSASFHPGKVKRTIRTFTCPECGEVLHYEAGWFAYVWSFFCLYGVPAFFYYFGYQYFGLLFISVVAVPLTFFFGIGIHSLFVAPKAQQKLFYGDSGLHLTDKPKRREDIGPTS
jgi:predicted RNA-binding Zn-ribbon protein involved in translation (DUF1610 family)